jgi:uncharacterized membrane protein
MARITSASKSSHDGLKFLLFLLPRVIIVGLCIFAALSVFSSQGLNIWKELTLWDWVILVNLLWTIIVVVWGIPLIWKLMKNLRTLNDLKAELRKDKNKN